jgi:beta-glucanase (GH16 family)
MVGGGMRGSLAKIGWRGLASILVMAGVIACPIESELEGFALQKPSGSQTAPAYPGFVLAWADEFDRPGRPDPGNWAYENGFVRNEELQWYQPENARVEGGMLIIEGRRERKLNPNYQAGSTDWKRHREYAEYTSSSLLTRGLHEWQYGRIEMRGRIDTRPGLWPAFWTLGVAGGWPRNGEIDIMEYYRGNLLANAAWGSAQRGRAIWDDIRKPISSFDVLNWSSQFHVWRMDWDENLIQLYVDGQLLNDIDVRTTVNDDGTNKNPFRQPHYLIVNLAIGGQGGDPSATEFPARYEVDYIRVYQKDRISSPSTVR